MSVCEALGQLNTTKQPELFLLQEKYCVKIDSAAIYKSTVLRFYDAVDLPTVSILHI